MKRVHVIIKGNVIGVFFRKFIKENADKLKIKGWVKNEKDYVEAVFEGKEADLRKILSLCHKGPPSAVVKRLNFKEEAIKGEKFFKILNNSL